MKLPRIRRPILDIHSIAVQTSIELAAGGILTVMLLRWIEN
jgi:hypothetical protein